MSKESKKGVRMGLSIISGFKKYLKELSEITGKKYNLNSTVSLFSNKKEMKQYFENELGVDTSDVLNKGISASEIDNLSVKNGKLVRGGAKAGKESDGTSLFDLVKQKNDAEKSENSSSDSSKSEDGSVFNDASQTTTGKNLLQDLKTKESKAAGDTVADVFNLLMQDEEFTKTLDTDGDGEINDEEMKAFFNTIKGNDENDKVISLDDILTAAGDISDGKLKTEDIKEEQDKAEEKDKAESSDSSSGASGASGSGGVGGGGGVSGSGGSGATAAANTQTTDEKTLDNMSVKEIETELQGKRKTLDSKNKDLNEALEGKSEELQKMQDKIDDSYKDYQKEMEKVDKKLAKEIDAKKQEVDTKEQAIRTQEAQIATDEQAVTDAETKVTDASSQRQNFENIVSELEASKGDSKDLTKTAEIDSKISAAKEQLEKAKETEEKAKESKTEAENKVKEDNEKKTELETELETLNQEMEELEKQLNDKATDDQKEKLEKLKEEWTKNKEDFETKRTELADKAKTEVKAAQKEVDTYEKALTEAKNRENQKEYGNSDISEDIIEFAKKYLGYNEADGSADEFMKAHGYTSATPWCAGFVDYILENCGDYDKVADWYKNVDNKLYCPDVYATAQSANAVVDASQAQAGDLVLFDWDGDGTKDHIGIVTDTSGGKIRTIEGNTSDQVAQREYEISDGRLKFCRITK